MAAARKNHSSLKKSTYMNYGNFYGRMEKRAFDEVLEDVFELKRTWTELYFEKSSIDSLGNENEYDFLLKMTSTKFDGVVIKFEKSRKTCKIKWKWNDDTSKKEIIEPKNVDGVASEFFERVFAKCNHSLISLTLQKIDFEFSQNSNKDLPHLETLIIETSNETTLCWALTKTTAFKYLVVSFHQSLKRQSKSMREFESGTNWPLADVEHLKLETNVSRVAVNIVSRLRYLKKFEYNYDGNDVGYAHHELFRRLERLYISSIHLSSCLDDEQFIALMDSCVTVNCPKGKITFDGINRAIEESMNSSLRRHFTITDVQPDVINSKALHSRFLKVYPAFSRKPCHVNENSTNFRQETGYTMLGDLRYDKESLSLTFSMSKKVHGSKKSAKDLFAKIRNKWSGIYFERASKNSSDNEVDYDYLMRLNRDSSIDEVLIKFKKIRGVCEIKWNWNDKTTQKTIINSPNLMEQAYDLFAKLLFDCHDSLKNITMNRINIDFGKSSIKCFPKLLNLDIITSKETTLYWILFKSPQLKKLTLSFREFESSKSEQNFDSLKNLALDQLLEFDVKTNVKSVAENIVYKSNNLEVFSYKFTGAYKDDSAQSNEALVNHLKKSSVHVMHILTCLDDQQFSDLVKANSGFECTKGHITYGGINRLIEELMDSKINRNFYIHNVHAHIIVSVSLNFKVLKKSKGPYRQIYIDERVRQHDTEPNTTIHGKLRYLEEKRILSFKMSLKKK